MTTRWKRVIAKTRRWYLSTLTKCVKRGSLALLEIKVIHIRLTIKFHLNKRSPISAFSLSSWIHKFKSLEFVHLKVPGKSYMHITYGKPNVYNLAWNLNAYLNSYNLQCRLLGFLFLDVSNEFSRKLLRFLICTALYTLGSQINLMVLNRVSYHQVFYVLFFTS